MSNEGYLNQPYALIKLKSLNEMLTRSKKKGWKEQVVGIGLAGGASSVLPGIDAMLHPPTTYAADLLTGEKLTDGFTETMPFNLESLTSPIIFTGAGLLAGYNIAKAKSKKAKWGYFLAHFGLEIAAFLILPLPIPKISAGLVPEAYAITSYIPQIACASADLTIQGLGFKHNRKEKQNYKKNIEGAYQLCLENLLSRPLPDFGAPNRYARTFLDFLGETISSRFDTAEGIALDSFIYETWKGAEIARKDDFTNIKEKAINIIRGIDKDKTTLLSYLANINSALTALRADIDHVYNANSFMREINYLTNVYNAMNKVISLIPNPGEKLNNQQVETISRYCYAINTKMGMIQRVIDLGKSRGLQKKGKEAYDNIVKGDYDNAFLGIRDSSEKTSRIHKKIINDFKKYGTMKENGAKNLLKRLLNYKMRQQW